MNDAPREPNGDTGPERARRDTPAGPSEPRWTHIALPVSDIDASIAWYERFTPLELLDRRADEQGYGAWLGHPDQPDNPFILVLAQFLADRGKGPLRIMGPFAHLGIEMPSRAAVDATAEQARAEGCLTWEPTDMPDPIGYICAISDPDGNVVEISHGQGVYAKAREVWGTGRSHRRDEETEP